MDYICDIIAEADDYQISWHRRQNHGAEVGGAALLVTFDVISSKKGTHGFGTSQAIKNGIDNLYVSQRRGTSYQQLSREDFRRHSETVFAQYDRILFYGHSLGGYASLYYSSLTRNAEVFAICPRCPAHPMFHETYHAKYGQDFRHEQIFKSPGAQWTILWDPRNADNQFIEENVGLENIDRQIRIKKLAHGGAPRILTVNKSLQTYVADWINRRELAVLPSFDKATNYILLYKAGRKLIRQQQFGEAVRMLERSLQLVDTPIARELLAQARGAMAVQGGTTHDAANNQRSPDAPLAGIAADPQ